MAVWRNSDRGSSHTRGAAERLHLTQQSISRTVGELERELGVTLLERTTREVRLTPAGVSLLRDGAEALRAPDAAFVRAREIGTGALGRVRVGVSPAIGPLDRDEIVRALRPPSSDVSVALHEVRPADLRPLLRSHELDIALTRVSGVDDDTLHSAPAGARVETVEVRVTGGAVLLTELAEQDVVALMPAGTPPRDGIASVPVEGFAVPLVLLWPAGRPSAAVEGLRLAL